MKKTILMLVPLLALLISCNNSYEDRYKIVKEYKYVSDTTNFRNIDIFTKDKLRKIRVTTDSVYLHNGKIEATKFKKDYMYDVFYMDGYGNKNKMGSGYVITSEEVIDGYIFTYYFELEKVNNKLQIVVCYYTVQVK